MMKHERTAFYCAISFTRSALLGNHISLEDSVSVITVLTDKPKLELTESLEFVLSKRDVQLSDAVHFHFYSFLF